MALAKGAKVKIVDAIMLTLLATLGLVVLACVLGPIVLAYVGKSVPLFIEDWGKLTLGSFLTIAGAAFASYTGLIGK